MEIVTRPAVPAAAPKHGQGMRALVEARQHELEKELSEIKEGAPTRRADIEAALSALKGLLTGDLDQIPPVLAQELSQWIETSKYLGKAKAVTKPGFVVTPKAAPNLRAFVEARHREHEVQLGEIKNGAPGKIAEIETALSALKALLTGDLDGIPPVVAQELSKWIETSEHLGAKPGSTAPH